MGKVLHTLISRLLILGLLILLFIPMLIILLMPERMRFDSPWVYKVMNIFYVGALKCALVPIKIRGEENIPVVPSIIAANHQSSLDIPLVGQLLNSHPHIWLARSELMDSWLLRFILPRLTVVVDVKSPLKSMRSLLNVISLVEGEQRHLVIFPEGQRYDDGAIHDFFGGFVILAKKTGRPVVPVRIFNANKVYPKDAFWAHWDTITVVVGAPLVMGEDEADDAFKERVRAWFLEQKES